MVIQSLIDKIHAVVDSHRIETGVYARYLWQDAEGSRKMGVNEYGCADAANILYSIGDFPRDPEERKLWVTALQNMQNPETGMFHEETHHPIHTTAHCLAALELFDAQPLYPLKTLSAYLDREKMFSLLDSLNWEHSPWNNSHQGAGLYAALAITRMTDPEWENAYFGWLKDRCDPATAMGLKDRRGTAPLNHQLNGWFHYLFNHEYARRPFPYPEALIDTCIDLYKNDGLNDAIDCVPRRMFGSEVGFMEIDWIFAMNRTSRQTPHRFAEVKELLWDHAQKFIAFLNGLYIERDDAFNDLHMLFGAVCALAELQLALPGKIETTVPLKNVLDRRPFI